MNLWGAANNRSPLLMISAERVAAIRKNIERANRVWDTECVTPNTAEELLEEIETLQQLLFDLYQATEEHLQCPKFAELYSRVTQAMWK